MSDSKLHLFRSQVIALALIALVVSVPAFAARTPVVKVKMEGAREQAASFYADQFSVSKKTASRYVGRQERERQVKIIDEAELPEGALLDFYRVRNHEDPAKRVDFEGRGKLVYATSYLGRYYKEILFGLLNTKQRDDAIKLLKQARDHGFMVVPTALDAGGPGTVRTAAAQTVTVIVIIPEFPHWVDPRPRSDGDTSREAPPTDVYYQTGDEFDLPPLRSYPMNGNNHAWEQGDPAHWFADSPGGTLDGGIPEGLTEPTTAAWSGDNPTATSNPDGHPRAGGEEWKPEFTLQNHWFNLVFNKANPNSLHNYYYQNSHGHISLEGDTSNVVGWVHDHHVLDRAPYPIGVLYAVQPGTPILRPTDPTGPGIVRASLYAEGLTLFLRSNAVPSVRLWVWQNQDINSAVDDDQFGEVELILSGGSTVWDPWEHRRYTLLDGDNWEFVDLGDATERIDYEPVANGSWRCRATFGGTTYEWSSTNPGLVTGSSPGNSNYRGQARGCGSLSGTTFTSADILGSADGNRLKSFCYYIHDHRFSAGASAYQLSTTRQPGGYGDPIAGSVDQSSDRVDRAQPFDHDMRDHSFPNAGAVLSSNSDTPGHSSDAMRGDVYNTLNDQGISYSAYTKEIFIFPDGSQSEGDPNASIIPHAQLGGRTLVVPEGAGLTLLAHEMGHTFGTWDLYDKNFYDNSYVPAPVPFFFECPAAGPYSVMAHGVRMDPWHKLRSLQWGPWAQETPVTRDLGFTQIGQVETTLRDPVILKLPAHPLAIYASKWLEANPGTKPAGFGGSQGAWEALADPDQWSEHFLVENRNVTGGSYFGDQSPVGTYIWHVDERNIGGEQRAEETMSVIPEQADGLYELETNGSRTQGGGFNALPGDLAGDPFPGSQGNTAFTERPRPLPNGAESPVSWSHGVQEASGWTIRPGTPTDSFVRITDISAPGNPMTANVFVEPAEVICTQPGQLVSAGDTVMQGTEDYPVLWLNLENDGTYPNLSTKAMTVNTIKIYEVGTSLDPANIALAKLYEDNAPLGTLDAGDTLLKTAPVQPASAGADFDHILFNNLGYVIGLDNDQNFIVAFDIAEDAETDPRITIGAELTTFMFIEPSQPGAVQMRERLATGPDYGYNFGVYRFPVTGNTATIIEQPDTLTLTLNEDLAPAQAAIGQQNVPMMQVGLTVNHDSVTIDDIQLEQTGSAIGGTDVSLVRVYHDLNGNGSIEAGEPVLGEAAVVGGSGAGIANVTGINLTVGADQPEYLIFTVNITPGADYTTPHDIRLLIEDTSVTLEVNPADPPSSHDIVAGPVSLPSGLTEIVEHIISGENIQPDPPNPPFTPDGQYIEVNTGQPTLSWQAATDPNPEDTPDNFVYEVQISTSSDWGDTGSILEIVTPVDGKVGPGLMDPTITMPILAVRENPGDPPTILQDDTRYFWRVRVRDRQTVDGLDSDWTDAFSFWVNSQNLPPEAPNTGFSPRNSVSVSSDRPVLHVNQAHDPDQSDRVTWPTWPTNALTYVFQLSTAVDFGTVAYQYTQIGSANQIFVEKQVEVGDELTDLTDWYWRVKARDDEGAESPWSAVQDFFVDTGNQEPQLMAPNGDYRDALDPKFGRPVPPTGFEFRVIYIDAENNAPADGVFVEIYDQTATLLQRLEMQKFNPADNTYTDGVEYIRGASAADLALGRHTFKFLTQGDTVEWPTPFDPAEAGVGPIIGTESELYLTDSAWDETAIPDPGDLPDDQAYEEGGTVYVKLIDEDKQGRGTLDVFLYTDLGSLPLDWETVSLTESTVPADPDGTFLGQIDTLGRPGGLGDGDLNVISGASGNTITVQYDDPDELTPDFPGSMTADTSNDQGVVKDTVAPPAIVWTTEMTAVSGVNGLGNSEGRSIDIDWSAYVADTSGADKTDIAYFDVFVGENGEFSLGPGGPVVPWPNPVDPGADAILAASVPAGATGYTVTGYEAALVAGGLNYPIQPGYTYYVAVVPRDEVPNMALTPDVTSRPVTPADTQDPLLANASPANGATEVALDSTISFDLIDPGVGIDDTTLEVWVTVDPRDGPAEAAVNVVGDATWLMDQTGTDFAASFVFTPPAGFFEINDVVSVRVVCDDKSGNSLDQTFAFDMQSDNEGPVVINQLPAPSATNIAPSTHISFTITDNVAGVDTASITVTVGLTGQPGTDVTGDCVIDDTDPMAVTVEYTPTLAIVPWNADITVSVTASDLANNDLSPDPTTWEYHTQLDDVAPAMSLANMSPAPGATDVQIDTAISFRIDDGVSGVDESTLEVYVNDVLVPGADLSIGGTAARLTVTYQPATRFDYSETVSVRVGVQDFALNDIAEEDPLIGAANGQFDWQFTCEPPPTYRIAGTIDDQDGDPLPGVTVNVYDQDAGGALDGQATTDGNGTYIYSIELGGNFRLVPELTEYDFDPVERTVAIAGADVMNQDFTGTLRTYEISGTVTLTGVGEAGVTVSDGTRSAVTDGNGDYTITGVPSGRYTVQGVLANHSFRPTSRTVVVEGAGVADIDFEAIPDTYSISGTVRDYAGDRIQGVRVTDGTRSTVTNEAGQFTLSDVPAGTVTIRVSKAGYKFVPGTQDATTPPAATGVDFIGYISFANSFPIGVNTINFLSVPCYPADEDPEVVFGTDAVARWNPTAAPPAYVMPGAIVGADVLDVRPGRGFFVNLDDADLDVAGRPVSTARAFTMTLGPIWNMGGNPFAAPLPFGNIVPAIPGSMRSYGYVYDAVNRGYLLISASPGVNIARTEVYPWEGIWLRTTTGSATANVAPPVGTAQTGSVAPQALELGSEGWAVQIVASAGGSIDTTTAVGVGPALAGAYTLENPPMAPQTVDVYLTAEDGRYLAQDIRPSAVANPSWQFTVATDIAGADVQVSLPDLSGIPGDRAVYLTDEATGKRMYVRTMTAYTFAVGDKGGKRDFVLEVAPKDAAGLVIANTAAANSAQGMVVTYSVSKDCRVTAQVTNIAGRVVRTVCDGTLVQEGVNALNWDLKSTRGTRVPNGRYIIRVTAAGEDGQKVQAVTSATLQR